MAVSLQMTFARQIALIGRNRVEAPAGKPWECLIDFTLKLMFSVRAKSTGMVHYHLKSGGIIYQSEGKRERPMQPVFCPIS